MVRKTKIKHMKPTVTTISTGYYTEDKELVEFFYTEDGFGGRDFKISSESKISLDEITGLRVDFTNRVNSFLGEQGFQINYELTEK